MSKNLTITVDEKTFQAPDGQVQALGQCHLEIAPGELCVLLGPSGCGKTTLIRLILGLDRDFRGTIRIGDEPVTGPGPDRGVVFQEPRLLPWLNIHRNLAFALTRQDHTNGKARRRVGEMLALVGLSGFEGRWPRELSGGMAQRAALARALVNVPDILLLDEPFGALDTSTRFRMQDELLRVLSATGTTALLVTHDIDEAVYLGDRIAVMSPRPGSLLTVHSVGLPHPRQRNDETLLRLRGTLMEELFSYAS